ncbi:MAG: sugar phosphate isomerase/epimerase [Chloroflexi bacterium]|nr:sugar phosphate isomerase/epimerase [Chloroflexota bacterium]
MTARILLKARPTPAQLADRLSPPLPEGLELYLDATDIAGDGWLEQILERCRARQVPDGFAWVVEGPLRSLDGEFFDLARKAAADREVLRRIVACAERLGARAVVIHCIAPTREPAALTRGNRERALVAAGETLDYYVDLCLSRGLVPTIENLPAVARMRESAFVYSLIGMAAEDLLHYAGRLSGLRLTCDTSHAQLYLNAAAADPEALAPELAAVARFVADPHAAGSLGDYLQRLGGLLYEGHVSNAAGLLGEGLPYDEGVADLDAAVARMLPVAEYLVTEPLEPDPNRAESMREVARRMAAVRQALTKGAVG